MYPAMGESPKYNATPTLIALIVLFANLYVFTANVGASGAAVAVAVAAGAVAFAALWKPPVRPPTVPSMQGGKSVSRADRISGAIGALVWTSLTIWMALAPFSLGWKLLFELVYIAGAVDYLFLFLGRPRVIDAIRSFLRGRGRTRN